MNTIHTTKRHGPIRRFFQRINVAVSLHYVEKDLAYERALADALPAKVLMLERHAQHLRVRQCLLRNP